MPRPSLDLLKVKGALHAEGERLHFADMEQLGRNPARIIPAWRDFLDQHAATGGENAVACEVDSDRRIEQPLAGRERPHPDQPRGRGLWLANQLCDLVQIRSGDSGSVMRPRMSLEGC